MDSMKSLASFLILTLVVSLLAACSPSGLPTPEPAASSLPPPIPKVTPTKEVLISFGAPSVSATLYGDAGNYALQAGVPAQVTWRDAPPAAESYAFTLKLHSDKSLRLIGTDTDETNGIGVEWLIPAFISGELKASAYFADGREVLSSAIDVYSYEAVPPGACVLRSQTIVPITVYKEPSDTAEIIGVMYPNSMLETIGKDTNGW